MIRAVLIFANGCSLALYVGWLSALVRDWLQGVVFTMSVTYFLPEILIAATLACTFTYLCQSVVRQ